MTVAQSTPQNSPFGGPDASSPSPAMSFLDRVAPRVITRWTRVLAWATLVSQIAIVGTGGAVRLTGSGLGCPTWPRCTPESYVNVPEMGIHGVIEFGNRLLTFVLVAIAILTFVSVIRTRSTGRGLVLPAVLVALYVPAQAIIGGITVLTGLNPYIVGLHYIASIVIVAFATWYVWRVHYDRRERIGSASAPLPLIVGLTAAAGAVTIVVGVLVTGSGPHAGDAGAARNGLDSEFLQHVHSWPAYTLLALAVAVAVLSHVRSELLVRRFAFGLLGVIAAQIAVGLVQARLGLPEILVGLHMVLACLVAAAVTATVLALRQRESLPALRG